MLDIFFAFGKFSLSCNSLSVSALQPGDGAEVAFVAGGNISVRCT
jgi:hypothetical protein